MTTGRGPTEAVPADDLPTGQARAQYVRTLFDAIAQRYDLMNRLMTLGRDAAWRKIAAAAVIGPETRTVLDVGAGTGDLSRAVADAMPGGGRIVALDFAAEMLGVARAKLQRRAARQAGRPAVVVLPVQGDALALPLRADACDALVTAFTVRNLADLDGALAEFHRVLRPEGRLASLEITSPTMPVFRTLFRYYFRHVVPLVGAAVAGYGAAYRYLPASVQAFLSRRQLQRRFQAAGFAQVTARPLALGTIALHTGTQVAHPQQQADLVTETVPAHEWDDLVLGLPGAYLLQGAAWAAAREQLGWTPHRLAFRRAGRLVGTALVLRRSLPVPGLGIGYVPKGPILAEWTGRAVGDVARALAAWARDHRVLWLKLDPDVEADNGAVARELEAAGFLPAEEQVQLPATMLVDLRGSEDELLARMHSKWRYNVRLAQRRGVQVREGDTDDLATFYRLYEETAARDHFVIRPLDYYRVLWEHLRQEQGAVLLLADVAGETVAGLVVCRYGRRAWFLYGASGARHRRDQPNHLLQWRAMQWAREYGCDTYDMWGAPSELREDDPLWGVYRFKQGFGGRYVRWLGAYDYVPHPRLYRAWQVALRLYRRLTVPGSS